jgi:predicted adenine nucleotide alpha hydrolase (AANH) superfamily ATPase
MRKLLLHICCAPDQTVAVERTVADYEVTGFFSNSCIEPKGEYYHRLAEAKKLAKMQGIEIIEDDYLPNAFLELAKGLEKEPERGKRCLKCIEYRLRRTFEQAKERGFALFATTLTVSPHKDADFINKFCQDLAWGSEVEYLPTNFKKQDGFKRSVELSKHQGLYRQDYCGCRFSLKEKQERDKIRAEQENKKVKIESDIELESKRFIDPAFVPPGAFFKPSETVSRRFRKGDKFKK